MYSYFALKGNLIDLEYAILVYLQHPFCRPPSTIRKVCRVLQIKKDKKYTIKITNNSTLSARQIKGVFARLCITNAID